MPNINWWNPGQPTSTPTTATTVDPLVQQCLSAQNVMMLMNLILIGVSAAVTVALSFTIRRTRLCVQRCGGRPGVAHPINFVDDNGRRWPFAFCYTAIISAILGLFFMKLDVPKWIFLLVQLLMVAVVCLIYYPLFACLTHHSHIVANIIGFCYALTIFVMRILCMKACIHPPSGNPQKDSNLYDLVDSLPIVVSLCILMFIYIYDFVCNIYWRRLDLQARDSENSEMNLIVKRDDTNSLPAEHFGYVHELLKKRMRHQPPEQPTSIRGLVMSRLLAAVDYFRYRNTLGFRYPLRLICTLTVCTLIVIVMVVVVQLLINTLFYKYEKSGLDELLKSILSLFSSSVADSMKANKVTLSLANVLSGVLHLVFIAHMMTTYKQHVLKYLKGTHKLHKKLNSSPTSILINSMSYPGYQMVAFFYGFILTVIVLYVVLMIIVYVIILPIRHSEGNFATSFGTNKIIPSAVLGFIIYIAQCLACRFLFLQDHGRVLALQNRRLFHVLAYFMFIFNFLTGFFSCAKRLLIALFSCTVLVSRLDFLFLVRGLEGEDSGHVAYMSMIVLDVCQNHPVMRTFLDLLQQSREKQDEVMSEGEFGSNFAEFRKRRIRNRWLKLRTLINNPSLVVERLQRLHNSDKEQIERLITRNAISSPQVMSVEQ